jgi:hypothetical protein
VRRRLPLIALALALGALAAGPAHAAGGVCDPTGDAQRADDCIAHAHVGATADGTMRAGQTITLRQRIADPLRGRPLVVEVQVRRVNRDGTPGPWIGLRRSRWAAAQTAARATRTVDVCRARLAGRYQFRTATRVPRAARTGGAARQAAGTVATSAPTTVLLPNQGVAGACPNSPDDEVIVEYFNEIEYNEDFYVVITDQGASFAVALSCPPQQSPFFPPSDFSLSMTLEGAPTGVDCNGASITLDKATLTSGGYAGCQAGRVCGFTFLVTNRTSQAVYSDTLVLITFTDGSTTYIPNLNPATIPICASNLNPCLLTGQCGQSTATKYGAIPLCTSGTCVPPPARPSKSYNDNIYFQAPVRPGT